MQGWVKDKDFFVCLDDLVDDKNANNECLIYSFGQKDRGPKEGGEFEQTMAELGSESILYLPYLL